MHKKVNHVHSLNEVMRRETELLVCYLEKEKQLFQCVFERNWEALDAVLQQMGPLSESIMMVDQERERIYSSLRIVTEAGPEDGFYQVIVRLPEEVRDNAAEIYRNMKITVFRLQALTGQIENYVKSISGTMREVLDELFPHQKGKLYSRKGMPAKPESNPMIISHHL